MKQYIHRYTRFNASLVKSIMLAVSAGLFLSGCHTLNDRDYVAVKKLPKQIIILEQNDMILEDNVDNLRKAVDLMRKEMKAPIKNNDAKIEQLTPRKAKVTLQNKILFKNGSANFSHAGKKVLSQFAKAMQKNKSLRVRIVGHTDDKIPTQRLQVRYLDNWEVGAARAASVARYLTWEQHIDAKKVTVISKADTQPVASNRTAKGRKLNRRVELYLEL